MVWRKKYSSNSVYKRNQIILALILLILLIASAVGAWVFIIKDRVVHVDPTPINETTVPSESSEIPIVEEAFNSTALQNTLDEWSSTIKGTAGVVIADTSGQVLASHNPDKVYFSASIYKLFVAYAGYQQVDSGAINITEPYINGHTRGECLDIMIKESDSPCAEKLWAEIGKVELTTTLKTYGIANTSMTAINTTASDVAVMLARIARSEGLSEESQAKLLESMRTQIYRDTLNVGFSSSVTVYNKIGFNELKEYHDTAIVKLADGRELIVAVLTDGVGTTKIIQLGTMIEAVLSS